VFDFLAHDDRLAAPVPWYARPLARRFRQLLLLVRLFFRLARRRSNLLAGAVIVVLASRSLATCLIAPVGIVARRWP